MKKILVLIILISCLAVPMVGLADWLNITYGDPEEEFLINGTLMDDGSIELNMIFGGFQVGDILPVGTFGFHGTGVAGEGIRRPFDFSEATCVLEHNLSDYKTCWLDMDGDGIKETPMMEGGTVADPLLAHCCLLDKVLTIGDYIFIILLVVAVIVFLLAAWGFLTSQGEPEKVKNARNYIIYAIIGVAVAFLAKALVRVVASIMA